MAEIIMPKVGDAMSEGKVVRWYKKAGDTVKKGEPVLEIETDKVNLDLEAEADGVLGVLTAGEGDMAPVGKVLARILAKGETEEPAAPAAAPKEEKADAAPASKDETSAIGAPAKDDAQGRRNTDKKDSFKHTTGEYAEAIDSRGPRRDRTTESPANEDRATGAGDRKRSSPLARRIAQELGVDLASVQGSGPRGRVVADDIKKAHSQPQGATAAAAGSATAAQTAGATPGNSLPMIGSLAPLETRIIPLSAMRRTIAKRLGESTGPIPHFYLTMACDVTSLLATRVQMNEIAGSKLSVNDFIIRAVALALRHHQNINASWGDDAITQHGEIHIGVAVATPEGLITPVVRNADQKSVTDIAAEVRALADKAKNRRLKPEEYQGSTFTISNLGAWGIEEFTAIINPPNAAILAVGGAKPETMVGADRQITVRDVMRTTLSCDHRVIDGVTGAEYLKTLRQFLEQPLRLLL